MTEKQEKKPAAKKAAGKTEKKPAVVKRAAPKSSAGRKAAPKKIVVKPTGSHAAQGHTVQATPARTIKVRAKTVQRAAERRSAKSKRPEGYFFAVGRRKRAVAQVKLWLDNKKQEITVNGRDYKAFFPVFELQTAVLAPLKALGLDAGAKIEIKVQGGGMRGQAEGSRHGISRALLLVNPDYRLTLKKLGFLTRDPREKERKKFGLKKARRAPQWAKR
jgi:small subunit ribosomal protein S9